MTGIELIAAERKRQIKEEVWTPEHDDHHKDGELALAACCYASPVALRVKRKVDVSYANEFPRWKTLWVDPWPWGAEWNKRNKHDRLRQLTIAGALIAAEIDRLQRKTNCRNPEPSKVG